MDYKIKNSLKEKIDLRLKKIDAKIKETQNKNDEKNN